MNILLALFDFLEQKMKLVNDLKNIDRNAVVQKVSIYSQASISFFILLISATTVCSLGLILNSPPVIIGGMLISPLMWPLMKISLGVASDNKNQLFQAMKLLIFSMFIAILSAYAITYFSPIKLLSKEILARASPTLLDIIIALAAGMIAALSIVQKKISDSLAGVAIATALMPPLCVSGIGLALQNYEVSTGGFMLFFANIISIIFISTIVFSLTGINSRDGTKIRIKGFITITAILVITALPLLLYLKDYSFQNSVYDKSKNIIEESLKQISKKVVVQNIQTDIKYSPDGNTVYIAADVIVPEDVIIDYQQQNSIISKLETTLNSKVDVSFSIQRALSIVSAEKEQNDSIKVKIIDSLKKYIFNKDSSIQISTVEIAKVSDIWNVATVLRINPTNGFSSKDKDTLQADVEKDTGIKINLDITLVPIISLRGTQDDKLSKIKNDLAEMISRVVPEGELKSISISSIDAIDAADQLDNLTITCDVTISIPSNVVLDKTSILEEKRILEKLYETNIDLKINHYQTDMDSF